MSYYEYIPFRSSSFVYARSTKHLLKGARPSRKNAAIETLKNDIRIANKVAIAKSGKGLEFDKPKTAFAGVLRGNLIRMATA